MSRRRITTRADYIRALERNGFVLVRTNKHFIYEHPSGVRAIVSQGARTSDARTLRNSLAGLRRQGIDIEEQA